MSEERTLTPSEKNAIRDRHCVLCLAMPPFADGSRCHVHRIVRGKDGGQYIASNVVPLCPECHYAVDELTLIKAAHKGGARGGRRTHELHPQFRHELARIGGTAAAGKCVKRLAAQRTPEERVAAARHASLSMAPEVRAANARSAAIALKRKHGREGLSAEERAQRVARAQKGGAASGRAGVERRRVHGLSERELAHRRKMAPVAAAACNEKYSAEERSAIRRRAWETRRARYGASGTRSE